MRATNPYPSALFAALIAGAVFTAPTVSALEEDLFHYDSTDDLYTICATPAESDFYMLASLACRAFIQATIQYHDAVTDRNHLKPLVCYPQGTTIEQARDAFVAWGQANAENAELMGEPPVKGLVRALAAKYPCAKR
ncbi:hypothetical protein CKO25_14215 [Thiocapsa imhoffii]|uniref:Rap1a immunity protein domain-containing protein n=1 Tax=Thiocapsa imhoffii TaxID=382777 RepID=A0A9X1BA76_9GAMM|nr:Rap1a/Tai family immunity protein [Thiocapsa imhoffii]MBK1645786.1 hypothetical protein [Thiocapsa imhoffii]